MYGIVSPTHKNELVLICTYKALVENQLHSVNESPRLRFLNRTSNQELHGSTTLGERRENLGARGACHSDRASRFSFSPLPPLSTSATQDNNLCGLRCLHCIPRRLRWYISALHFVIKWPWICKDHICRSHLSWRTVVKHSNPSIS